MIRSVLIRPAVPSDIAALTLLFEELDEYHRLRLPNVFRKPMGARREQSQLDSTMAGPDRTILVAEGPDQNVIGLVVLIEKSVGATIVRDARRFVEIDELVVNAAARRLRVGWSLIDASKSWARDRGISMIEVSAWSVNVGAMKFYSKLGFRRTTVRFSMTST